MPHRESGNQNEHALPVAPLVHGAECRNEQYMIISVFVIQDMITPQPEIHFKLAHVNYRSASITDCPELRGIDLIHGYLLFHADSVFYWLAAVLTSCARIGNGHGMG